MLSNFLLLGAPRSAGLIRMTALQGVLLAALLAAMQQHALLVGAVLLIKGLLLPGMLRRTQKKLDSGQKGCPSRRNTGRHGGAPLFHMV